MIRIPLCRRQRGDERPAEIRRLQVALRALRALSPISTIARVIAPQFAAVRPTVVAEFRERAICFAAPPTARSIGRKCARKVPLATGSATTARENPAQANPRSFEAA